MKTSEALKIVGGLSKPSKMPGWAYGLPAKECKTGSKLVKVPGSVCHGCYALKGCYVFKVVQDEAHLLKIFAVAKLTPTVKHWMPTREAWVKHFLPECPENLIIRFSVPMVDQSRHKAPKGWKNTSTVSSDLNKTFTSEGHFCPAPKQGNSCQDCRACWDGRVSNIVYGKH